MQAQSEVSGDVGCGRPRGANSTLLLSVASDDQADMHPEDWLDERTPSQQQHRGQTLSPTRMDRRL